MTAISNKDLTKTLPTRLRLKTIPMSACCSILNYNKSFYFTFLFYFIKKQRFKNINIFLILTETANYNLITTTARVLLQKISLLFFFYNDNNHNNNNNFLLFIWFPFPVVYSHYNQTIIFCNWNCFCRSSIYEISSFATLCKIN